MLFLQELVIRVNLPGTQHAKQAELNVESEKLELTVTGKYHLQLFLPHRVAAAEGTASFNSSKQQLEMVLPVVPSAPSASTDTSTAQQQQQQQAKVGTQSQDRGASSAHECSDSMHDCDLASSLSACAISSPEDTAPKDDQLAEGSLTQQDGKEERGGVAQHSSESAKTEPLTANQRKWLELHPKALSSKDDVTQSSASHAAATVDTDTLRAAAAAGRHECCAVTASCWVCQGTHLAA